MSQSKKRPKAYSYIRFSTPEQRKGDSLRRQTEAAENYAHKNGLTLDDSLKPDEGLSAYSGIHRTKGALGQFLKVVEGGQVPKGSVLIVESLDRLSREQVLDAAGLFMQIVNAGIKVVTLQDAQEYTRESVNANFGQLIMSIVVLSRAHEESATKAKRLSAAWSAKRGKIEEGVPLTARCPAWLRLPTRIEGGGDERRFKIIPERAKTVKLIFKKRLAGKGPILIERELNENPPPWVPEPNGWRKSYIVKILQNPAVIGKYQPYQTINEERAPIGDLVPDYFPAVVDDASFYAVQAMRRGSHKGGPTGRARNLFVYLARCGFCLGNMVFVDKGKSPKGGQYLVCDNARRKRGCEYHSIRYDEVERVLLDYCRGLNVQDVLPDDGERNSRLAGLRDVLTGIEGKLSEVRQKVENLTDQIAVTNNPKARALYEAKLNAHLETETTLEQDRRRAEQELAEATRATDDADERIKSLAELHERLRRDGDGSVDLRLRLRAELKRLIKVVNIFPVAVPEKGSLERWEPDNKKEEDWLTKMLSDPKANRAGRYLKVYFRGGGFRVLYPEKDHPLALDVKPRIKG